MIATVAAGDSERTLGQRVRSAVVYFPLISPTLEGVEHLGSRLCLLSWQLE
jgi:hypothetical protein